MSKSMNHQYIESLIQLGKEDERVVTLDADLSKSSRTCQFKDEFPNRAINCGIAEQNMTGVAGGLAYCGKVPFIHSIAPFVVRRNYDQLYQSVALPNLNVKVVGMYAGLNGQDGSSHQIVNDISMMASLPNFNVLVPSNSHEVKEIMKGILEIGPTYLRLSRSFDRIDVSDYVVEIGKISEIKPGEDVALITTGIMLPCTIDLSKYLEQKGISTGVYSCHSIKPFDEEKIVMLSKNIGKIVVLEEHLPERGLYSLIINTLARNNPTKILSIGVKYPYSGSGSLEDLFIYNELMPKQNFKKVRDYIHSK